MPRKTFLNRHTKASVPDEPTAAKYLLRWYTGDLYRSIEQFPLLTSQALFGNDLPMELEIGCGTGEFLCGLAAERSGVSFVGLDINLKSLFVGVERASALSLENVKFIKAPIQFLYPLMPSGSLQAVYMHFPDPLLRPKYRKRKVLNEEFLRHLSYALQPDGLFSIVTDNDELFESVLALVEESPYFRKMHTERYLSGFEPQAKSRYQLYWEAHDKPIFRLRLASVKRET
ncbi:MAG: methyltransferase domain-containing protein [Chloroflexia bacterium]